MPEVSFFVTRRYMGQAQVDTTSPEQKLYDAQPSWRKPPKNEDRGRGQPTKYHDKIGDKWLVDELIRYIVAGATKLEACDQVHISYDSMNEWERKFSDFSDAVRSGESQFIVNTVMKINIAGSMTKDVNGNIIKEGDWRALAWLLEKRYPDKFGNVQKITNTNLNINQDSEKISNEDLMKVLESVKIANEARVRSGIL